MYDALLMVLFEFDGVIMILVSWYLNLNWFDDASMTYYTERCLNCIDDVIAIWIVFMTYYYLNCVDDVLLFEFPFYPQLNLFWVYQASTIPIFYNK